MAEEQGSLLIDDLHSGSLKAAVGDSLGGVGGVGGSLGQVHGVQPHGCADFDCVEESSAETGGNSGRLVEGLPGGALLHHAVPGCEGAKAEVQADCVV